MNRRQALKLMGATVIGSILPITATAHEKVEREYTNARLERYRRYMRDSHLLDPDATEALAIRIYNKLELDKIEWKGNNPFSFYRIRSLVDTVALFGDEFREVLSHEGVPMLHQQLPSDTMFRIETIKGKLLEFQQSVDGPDYMILRIPVEDVTKSVMASSVVRFHPDEVIHIRPKVGKYYPYGTSAIDTGRMILDNEFERDVTEGIQEMVRKFKLWS
jgi:hypothetical protein